MSFHQMKDLRLTDLLLHGIGDQGFNRYTNFSAGPLVDKSCLTSLPNFWTHSSDDQHKKIQKYGELCNTIGARFLPLAVKTFGRIWDDV